MAKAVLCPVCNGEGYVRRGEPATANGFRVICPGCGGKCWVEVAEDYYTYPYYPPTHPMYPNYPCPASPWYPDYIYGFKW